MYSLYTLTVPDYSLLEPADSHCLSGNPKFTPKGGNTKRWKPLVAASSAEYLAMRSTSSLSRATRFLFSSMREGVTDFASTEEPRATACLLASRTERGESRKRGMKHTMPAQQHRRRANSPFLRNFHDRRRTEQR